MSTMHKLFRYFSPAKNKGFQGKATIRLKAKVEDEVIQLGQGGKRPWQLSAFTKLKDLTQSFLVACTGSGKTTVLIALMIHWIVSSKYKGRALVVVPNNDIAFGFAEKKGRRKFRVELDSKVYEWGFGKNDFTQVSEQKVKAAVRWFEHSVQDLRKPYRPTEITGSIGIITYQAFTRVYEVLVTRHGLEGAHKLLGNCAYYFDEAHRIQGIFEPEGNASDTDLIALDMSNVMGTICSRLLSCENVRTMLVTATDYRNAGQIVAATGTKWEQYTQPFLDHWRILQEHGTEAISMHVAAFRTNVQLVDALIGTALDLVRQGRYPLITVPSATHGWRRDSEGLLQKLRTRLETELGQGLVDLVDQNNRAANDERVKSDPAVSLVMTQKKFREGSDWPSCDVILNTSVENSLNITMQTLGRAMRPVEGKVSIDHYSFVGMTEDTETFSSVLNNQYIYAIAMENKVTPIKLTIRKRYVTERDAPAAETPAAEAKETVKETVPLEEALGPNAHVILSKARRKIQKLVRNNEFDREVAEACILDMLDEYGIIENREEVIEGTMEFATRGIPKEDLQEQKPEPVRLLPAKQPKVPSVNGLEVGAIVRDCGFDYTEQQGSLFVGRYGDAEFQHFEDVKPDIFVKVQELQQEAMSNFIG